MEAREARRKKLMNRGTDRLAFITGQTRSLPPSLDYQPLTTSPEAVSFSEEKFPGSASAKIQASNQNSSGEVQSDAGKEVLPLSSPPPRIGTSSEIFEYEIGNESSKTRTSSSSNRAAVFTSKQISSAISASEDIRLLCSLVIALLVVILSHAGALSINFRPLLLVLLTDITVVFGLILRNRERRGEEETRSGGQRGDGLALDMSNLLGVAILSQKAIGAFFVDISICAVIMVCGIVV